MFTACLRNLQKEMFGCFAQVEGTCSGKFGYIVCVPVMHEIGQGVIREGTGFAQFRVRHTAIAFRPFKGEVMDTVVTSVSKARRPTHIAAHGHRIPAIQGRGHGHGRHVRQ